LFTSSKKVRYGKKREGQKEGEKRQIKTKEELERQIKQRILRVPGIAG
jgi:hypothetical protein